MKKCKKRGQPQKKDFAEKLANKLRRTELGEVDEGALSDDSGRWVSIKIGDSDLCFSFDMEGENIDRIGLYKDIIEIVDQKMVWGK